MEAASERKIFRTEITRSKQVHNNKIMWMHQADNPLQTHSPDNTIHQTVNSRCYNLHNKETQPYQTQKHVLLLVTSMKPECTLRMAHQKKKPAPVFWHTQHGHAPFLSKCTQENGHVPTGNSLSAAQKLPTSSWQGQHCQTG